MLILKLEKNNVYYILKREKIEIIPDIALKCFLRIDVEKCEEEFSGKNVIW